MQHCDDGAAVRSYERGQRGLALTSRAESKRAACQDAPTARSRVLLAGSTGAGHPFTLLFACGSLHACVACTLLFATARSRARAAAHM